MYNQYPIVHMVNYGDTLYTISKFYNVSVQDILNMNPYINPYNLSVGQLLTIIPEYRNYDRAFNGSVSEREFNLMKKMRMVWVQHVYWTRMFIISVVENLKDVDATTKRLLRNPKDIADVFVPYYGTAVGNTIEKLLTEHLTIGADLVKAAKNKNTADVNKFNTAWYANADDIANALSSINPYYDREEVRKMLYKHLELTTDELNNRLAGKYAEDIISFDKIEQEILMMADYFVNGIVKQFPDTF